MNQLSRTWLIILATLLAACATAKRSNNDHRNANHGKNPVNVTAVTGVDVDLKCKIRLEECGNFYSVAWYRERQNLVKTSSPATSSINMAGSVLVPPPSTTSQRVYVYRHGSGRGKAEGAWRGRAQHSYDAKRHFVRVSLILTI